MATIKQDTTLYRAVHPVEVIKNEMQARGLKQRDLAERLGMHTSNLSTLLKERRPVTPALAAKMEDALGIPAYMWLTMQAKYDSDVKALAEETQTEGRTQLIERTLREFEGIRELLTSIDAKLTATTKRLEALGL